VNNRLFITDPLVLAWLNRPFIFNIATSGDTREISLTNFTLPSGIQNPFFPGVERYTRYTGLQRGTTWTAYDGVTATVRALFPSMVVNNVTYNKAVQISYQGKDWNNRDRFYDEWRADGIGRIRLISNDFTMMELTRFTKP
jgi:hypothetical protein